ncbi:recombinase family protein [Corallococcus exiguus]|uniref:recombinase family protein n=1 Tax=Corallococcus exiguus TaxID=83462 RepID=UPI0010DB3B12|nr:recombinase family protein [Corallococcus exiguus]NRD63940.1 recombinase family protein [Corallococcus exiguus]RYZ41693.1 MAG: recombinase family protein [Myxococcaceae bacterium]
MRKSKPAPSDAKRCAVYTRKSTAAGLEMEFNSLDAQRESCVSYVQRQPGWALVDESYDDGGFTGANMERPAFQRLMQDVDAGRVDVVVVYKVDRLSRSLLDFAKVMERLNTAGASFVSVTQNFSTADAMGRLTLNMLMSFAEFEREMISERTRDKVAAARRKGLWTGGRAPLGYDVKDKRLVVNEYEAVVVGEAFELYLQHQQASTVARLLNETGRKTKRYEARSGATRAARAWTTQDVLRLLRSPLYAGFVPYGDETHPGEHPAIVDGATFHRVQDMLEGPGLQYHGRNPDYVLRGLLRCGLCCEAMTPGSTRKGTREYRYYRCTTRDKQGKEGCRAAPIPAAAMEDFVVARLREVSVGEGFAAQVHARLTGRLEEKHKALRVERSQLPRDLAKRAGESRKWVDSLAKLEGPARRIVEEKLTATEEEVAGMRKRLAAVERALDATQGERLEVAWVAQALADFDAVWDALTAMNRGRLLRALVGRVVVNEATGQVDVYLSHAVEAAAPGREEAAA